MIKPDLKMIKPDALSSYRKLTILTYAKMMQLMFPEYRKETGLNDDVETCEWISNNYSYVIKILRVTVR